jgi:hypothetical protein
MGRVKAWLMEKTEELEKSFALADIGEGEFRQGMRKLGYTDEYIDNSIDELFWEWARTTQDLYK